MNKSLRWAVPLAALGIAGLGVMSRDVVTGLRSALGLRNRTGLPEKRRPKVTRSARSRRSARSCESVTAGRAGGLRIVDWASLVLVSRSGGPPHAAEQERAGRREPGHKRRWDSAPTRRKPCPDRSALQARLPTRLEPALLARQRRTMALKPPRLLLAELRERYFGFSASASCCARAADSWSIIFIVRADLNGLCAPARQADLPHRTPVRRL